MTIDESQARARVRMAALADRFRVRSPAITQDDVDEALRIRNVLPRDKTAHDLWALARWQLSRARGNAHFARMIELLPKEAHEILKAHGYDPP